MNALQRRRHLTRVLIPEKTKEKSVQRNTTLKKQRSKRANKVWNMKKTTEASEQNRRTCISLKNRTSSLFLSTREVRSHSSLDSVGRAGSRPPALPAQGWGVCLYALQGWVWVLGCLERMRFAFPEAPRSPGIPQLHLCGPQRKMWHRCTKEVTCFLKF